MTEPVIEEAPEGDEEVTPSEGGRGNIDMEESTAAKAAAGKENDTERIAELLGRRGERAPTEPDVDMTKPGEDDESKEDNEEDNGLANSPWAQRMNHAKPAQRTKKQTNIPQKKPNFATVLYT